MQISKGVKMCLDTKLCLVIIGFFCSSIIVLNNCRKLDGYKFPVYTTTFCPRIKTEWNERSSALNCNKSNGYMCLPNDRFDELLEFCYREPVERIQKGFCLYLVKKVSLVHSYSCSRFTQGCHDHPFFSNEIYKYPACISIGNGCFLAEPSCKSKTSFRIQNGSRHFENVSTNEWNGSTTTHSQLSSERPQLDITPINDDDDTLLVPIILGISIPLCILSLLFGYYIKRKYQLCRTNGDVERPGGEKRTESNNEAIDITLSKEEIHREEEFEPLLGDGKPDKNSTDSLEMEEINHKSQIRRNSKSHEGQLPTSSLKEDKATKVQEEYQLYRTNGDVERQGGEKLTKSNNEAINITQSKEEIHTEEEFEPLLGDGKPDKKSTDSLGMEEINPKSQIRRNSKSHEGQLPAASLKDDKATKVQEYQLCRTNGDVERPGGDQLTKSNNEAIAITQSKEEYQLCRTNGDVERPGGEKLKKSNNEAIDITQSKEEIHREEEFEPLLGDGKPDKKSTDSLEMEEVNPKSQIRRNSKSHEGQLPTSSLKEDKATKVQESKLERDLFDQWKQDDLCFISTKACEEVEKNVKSKSLVIVAGHSGSGKSAIIQHIALKYRKQGWTVKRVKKVKDIMHEYSASRFQKNKTICVFNDPLGKESFDEQLNNSWQTYEEELKIYLKTAKLIMSCRNHIISDTRVTRYLLNHTHTVNIDDNKYKLSVDEKRKILKKHTFSMNISKTDCGKILEAEMYFPLLCKLFSSKEEYKDMGIHFFTEPVTVLKEEIIDLKKNDKGKYCVLALLVLFNDNLCVSEIFKNEDTENKFKHALKLAGLPNRTPPSTIGDNLYCITDFFVKRIGDTYHFYHDFVMEVTTCVFGTDYPAEIIKYADVGFLRKRVKLGNCDERKDPFNIYLNERYTEELGERLYIELFGECLLDVVLNPCLRNEKVIKVLKEKITEHPENLNMLLEAKKLAIDKKELDQTSKNLFLSKLSFLNLENVVSPLFALIAFCHTDLSQCCLNTLEQIQTDVNSCISALYCNGSIDLLFTVLKDFSEEHLKKKWGRLCPIDIVSVFHNYELLGELIKKGVNINNKNEHNGGWTPLMLAAGNDTKEYGDYYHGKTVAERRNKTVQLLLTNGADINLCMKNGVSPLYIACENGHDSTVQLLLTNGADINLCMEDGPSPFYIACENGHDGTVQLLLTNGADINLCEKNGASPLYIACQNGHDSTIQLLLTNGADINLCRKNGVSPLYIACQNGHDSTVQRLLTNGADINLCEKNGASPLHIACENGHDSTVQLLLTNGADINLCMEDGVSPLYIACENGHDITVHLLLTNGADINSCTNDGFSPLYIACGNGHDSTVQILLNNGADINLRIKEGVSVLCVAFVQRRYKTVNMLLNNGVDTSLACGWEVSTDFVDCFDKYESTVEFLKQKDNILNNLYDPDSFFSLFVSCQVERVTRMIFEN